MPPTAGVYGREWRTASSNLTRALGRPIRDQVHSLRPSHASTLQALELVNGEIFTQRLSRGARRLLGELPPEPLSLYNRTVAGRTSASSAFEVDVSKAAKLWLVVQENGFEQAGGAAAGVGAGGARRSGRRGAALVADAGGRIGSADRIAGPSR